MHSLYSTECYEALFQISNGRVMISVLFCSIDWFLERLSSNISCYITQIKATILEKERKKSVSVALAHMAFKLVDKTHLVSCIKAIAFTKMGKLVWHSKENHVSNFSHYWSPGKIRMKMILKEKWCTAKCVSFLSFFIYPNWIIQKYQIWASSWLNFTTKILYSYSRLAA